MIRVHVRFVANFLTRRSSHLRLEQPEEQRLVTVALISNVIRQQGQAHWSVCLYQKCVLLRQYCDEKNAYSITTCY